VPNNSDPARLAFATLLATLDQRIGALETYVRAHLPLVTSVLGSGTVYNAGASMTPIADALITKTFRGGSALIIYEIDVYYTGSTWPANGLALQAQFTPAGGSMVEPGFQMYAVAGGSPGGSSDLYAGSVMQMVTLPAGKAGSKLQMAWQCNAAANTVVSPTGQRNLILIEL
jgi:hypothetical protein